MSAYIPLDRDAAPETHAAKEAAQSLRAREGRWHICAALIEFKRLRRVARILMNVP